MVGISMVLTHKLLFIRLSLLGCSSGFVGTVDESQAALQIFKIFQKNLN